MKKVLLLIVFPACLLAAELVDRIVAVVGNEVITLSDLKNYHGKDKKDALEELIREKLLEQEMERISVIVTDDDLGGTLREVLARNRMSLEELKAELAKKGQGFDAYKTQLRHEIRRMKFMGQVIFPRIRVSEEEISRKLGKNPAEEDRLRVRQELIQSRLSQELENYLDEVRQKTYVEIKK